MARCLEKTLDVYLWATKEHLPEIEQETQHSTNVGDGERVTTAKSKISPVAFLTDIVSDSASSNANENKDFILDETVYDVDSLQSELSENGNNEDGEDSGYDKIFPHEWLGENVGSVDDLDRSRLRRVAEKRDFYDKMKSLQTVLTTERQVSESDSSPRVV